MGGPRRSTHGGRGLCGLALLVLATALAGQGAGAATGDPVSRCHADQLKALSKLCKAAYKCEAKAVKSPAFDAASCTAAAEGRLVAAWNKALARAGVPCALEDVGGPQGTIVASATDLAARVRSGVDQADPAGARLAGSLVKGAAAYCGSSLKVWSKQAKRPRILKTARAGGRARLRWARGTERALTKAEKAGLFYAGPDSTEIVGDVDQLVIGLVAEGQPLPALDFVGVSNAPGDALFLRTRTSAGDQIDYFGTKDESGVPLTLTDIRTENASGEVTQLEIGEDGRPSRAFAPDGTTIDFLWDSDTQLVVQLVTANGDHQANVAVDLATGSTAGLSVPTRVSSPHRTAPHRAPRGGRAVFAEAACHEPQAPRRPRAADGSVVTVTRCGQPVENANVNVLVSRAAGTDSYRAVHVGGGSYDAKFPTIESDLGDDLEGLCLSIAGVMTFTCPFFDSIHPAAGTATCTSIGGTIASLDARVGGAILYLCNTVFLAGKAYCATFGAGVTPNAPTLADAVCANIDGAVGRVFPDTVLITPTAIVPRVGFITARGQNANRFGVLGGFPDFEINVDSDVDLVGFGTVPHDPDPFQDYQAIATVACGDVDTEVTMSVAGDDGYMDETQCTLPFQGTCTLFVPGAAQTVRDVITVSVEGRPGSPQIRLEF